MFEFLNQEPYEDRVISRSDFDWGFISTVKVNDGRKLFETAIKHPDYNDGDMIIVGCYDTKKEARKGHEHWEDTMETPPKELVDIANSQIQQLTGKVTFKRKDLIK